MLLFVSHMTEQPCMDVYSGRLCTVVYMYADDVSSVDITN